MHIDSVKLNAAGEVTDIMLNGNTYGMKEAVKMAKAGKITGVKIIKNEHNEQVLELDSGNQQLKDMPQFEIGTTKAIN